MGDTSILTNIMAGGMGILFALVFGGISFYAFRTKKPMHFFSGVEVKPNEISNIPAYNRENGKMWLAPAILFFILGLIGFIAPNIALIIMGAIFFPGLFVMIFAYIRIKNKYKA